MDFGYMLKTLRIEAGIGLRELARNIDISPSYLSMIENRQLPPPTPARVAQIEQVLNVPKGCLLSLIHGLDPDLRDYLDEVPEIVDFLRLAKEKKMRSKDFLQLTGLLNGFGLKGLNLAIKRFGTNGDGAASDFSGGPIGPYLWPYLSEKLISDVKGLKRKAKFLEYAVALIAGQAPRLDSRALLTDLLEREEVASTGIGHGIAIPHAFADGIDGMIVALFRAAEGLDFDAIDERPAHLIFVMVGPHSAELLHLKLLARIARLFGHSSIYRKVLKAPDHKEIISALKSAEMGIP